MKTIRMEQMTWPEIKQAIESGFTTAVLAVGSTEQHGPHLPTMTDARIGDILATNGLSLSYPRSTQRQAADLI